MSSLTKMVRTNFGPPRFKARSFTDGPSRGPSDEHYRNRRDAHGPPGMAPPSWRDNRGRGRPPFTSRGRPPFTRRPPPSGGRREPSAHPWRPQSQNSFQTFSSQTEPHHGHRRSSPSRPNPRPTPPAQHRPSSHSPGQHSPGHRAPPFHRHPSGHRSLSPRPHHGHPPDRRAGPTPLHRAAFRGPKWQPSPSQDEGSWDSHGSQHSPRERQYEHSAGAGKRWNGAVSHPHGDEPGPSGSHRKPREFHGRGSYPERSRPSTSYQSRPQERQEPAARKRRLSDSDMQPPGPAPLHPPGPAPLPDDSKRPRREVPQLLCAPRGFGGKPLSLRDKSRILKGRQTRGESPVRLRAAPLLKPKPPVMGDLRSLMATKQKPNAGPLKKMESRKPPQSLTNPDRNTSKPSRRSDAPVTETRGSLSKHRSPPIDKLSGDLVVVSHWQAGPSSHDLSATRDQSSKSKTEPSSCVTSSSRFQRGRHVEIRTQRTLTMSGVKPWERPGRAFRNPGPEHTQVKPWERPGRAFRNPGPEHTQRPNFYGGPRRPGPGPPARRPAPGPPARRPAPGPPARRPAPGPAARRPGPGPAPRRPIPGPAARRFNPGPAARRFNPGPAPRRPIPGPAGRRPNPGPGANFRKPLMEGFFPRPFPQQKPAFRKSQSIMSKYRNMQSVRHRGPNSQGPNQQRW